MVRGAELHLLALSPLLMTSEWSAWVPYAIASLLILLLLGLLIRSYHNSRAAVARSRSATYEAEAKMHAVVNSAVDGIITIDSRGVIETVNPAAEKLFGYSAPEMIGRNVSLLMPPPYQAEHDQYIRNYLETGLRRIIGIGREVVGKRKDGSTFPMDLAVSEVKLDGRRIFVGIVHDVSQRKEAEEALRQAKENAEAANRAKDEFLATVSHELRTPLTAIVGWARLLKISPHDADILDEGIETISRNAAAQAQLVEDILDISRIITGRLRLNIKQVDLGHVIDGVIQTVRPAADAKRIGISSAIDHDVGPVSGDPDRLQQVVWNLLANAIKFSPHDSRVEIRLGKIGSQAAITIQDWGKGIGSDFLPYIFDRFRQAEGGITRRYGGLGLGLAIVRHLVELHGGSISVHSEGKDKGSTFTVVLPLLAVKIEEPSPHPVVAPREKVKFTDDKDDKPAQVLNGLRVLAVDDEPDARRLISTVLGRSGAQVSSAGSVAEAMQMLGGPPSSRWPDILVSDIGMPEEDGFMLIRRVRDLESGGRRLPAAALTAYTRMEDRMRVLAAGFQTYVPKPVEPDELVAVVANLAGRSGKKS
jgi:PAS domain S-box-containing protein